VRLSKRVGVLMTLSADDVIGQTRVAALLQGLQQAGWEVGRKLRIETGLISGGGSSTGFDSSLSSTFCSSFASTLPSVRASPRSFPRGCRWAG
jgi:hypothetical protein